MTLIPTNATVQGRRVWLQDAEEADVEYIKYHMESGLGLHIQHNPKLPPAERIETNGTTNGK